MTNRQDPLIGKEIDVYKVETLLGKGGMGAVYKCWDNSLQRPVAMKVMAEALIEDTDAVKRFEREARVIAEINHPNIAQVYRIGQFDGIPYYAMEYIDGRSLLDHIKEIGKVAGSRFYKIAIQAAQGLKAASEKNIIHRDIKPANIMITRDEVVKIVDFGIAKAFIGDSFKTATGMLLGSPAYMSPEQGRGAQIDYRTDIYSLGVTFYHMITGKLPFEADSPINMIAKHIKDPVRNIKELNQNVPDKLCLLIYGMLEKNPADRISDYSQIIISLQNLAGERSPILTYSVVNEPVVNEPSEEDKKKQKMIIYGAIAFVVLILLFTIVHKMIAPPPEKEPRKNIKVKTIETGESSESEESVSSDESDEKDSGDGMGNTLKQLNQLQEKIRKDKKSGE